MSVGICRNFILQMIKSIFSEPLQRYLEKRPPSPIEVIVELKNDPNHLASLISRQAKITNIKISFSEQLESINNVLKNTGGIILDTAWINKTIKVRIPVNGLNELANIQSIKIIDLPHQIRRDVK